MAELRCLHLEIGCSLAENRRKRFGMKTSVDRLDALFGEKVTVEIPAPNGGVKRIKVTKKWVENMEMEGKIKQVSSPIYTAQSDPLLDKAKSLVEFSKLNALSFFSLLTEHFSILRNTDADRSHYVLTVATVFMAASRLNNLRGGDAREEMLMEIVAKDLDEWDPDAIRGFEDCKELYENVFDHLTKAGSEPSFVASDAVGTWIVWNILGQQPQSEEEAKLARVAGGIVTAPTFNYWDL